VTLGNIGTYTGLIGAIFATVPATLQAWAQYTNAHGGLNCHPVKVVSEDDGGDPSQALTDAEQLVSQYHVIAFMDNFQVLTIQAVTSYLEQQHIPVIGGDDASTYWYDSPVLFPQASAVPISANGVTKYAASTGATKLAGFYCVEDSFCTNDYNAVVSSAAADGVQSVYASHVSLTSPDFTAQCIGAKNAGATVVFLAMDGNSSERIETDCAAQGYHPVYYTISIAVTAAMQGEAVMNGTLLGADVFPWVDNTTPAEAAYHAAINQYAPSVGFAGPGALTWAAGELVVAASKDLGANPTSDQFFQGLYTIKNNTLGGLTPPLTFTNNGANSATVGSCYWVMKLNNGQWEDLNNGTPTC
jgi:branched-chain amino acid transport system substrate-binding protein